MFKMIIALVLMQSLTAQAEVVHHIRFCAGKFCAVNTSFSLALQLEMNQKFKEGSLIEMPTKNTNLSKKIECRKQVKFIQSKLQPDFYGPPDQVYIQ